MKAAPGRSTSCQGSIAIPDSSPPGLPGTVPTSLPPGYKYSAACSLIATPIGRPASVNVFGFGLGKLKGQEP
jgi:hypothetical protein